MKESSAVIEFNVARTMISQWRYVIGGAGLFAGVCSLCLDGADEEAAVEMTEEGTRLGI